MAKTKYRGSAYGREVARQKALTALWDRSWRAFIVAKRGGNPRVIAKAKARLVRVEKMIG